MESVLYAIAFMTVSGAICSVVICAAAKFMAVETDERAAEVLKILPGSNCGACGFPGCEGYANALISGKDIKSNLCSPGGDAVMRQLSEMLGLEAGAAVKRLAIIHCGGDCQKKQKKMEYEGVETCAAAKQIFGGESACTFGCLGYGDCKAVCPNGAICIENGLARINPRLCNGCGLCTKACPNLIISVEDASATTVVKCSSIEKGAVARKKCSASCIGCRKCARECPSQAITVEDNLSKIDYEKCTRCGYCAEICVTQCIQRL